MSEKIYSLDESVAIIEKARKYLLEGCKDWVKAISNEADWDKLKKYVEVFGSNGCTVMWKNEDELEICIEGEWQAIIKRNGVSFVYDSSKWSDKPVRIEDLYKLYQYLRRLWRFTK